MANAEHQIRMLHWNLTVLVADALYKAVAGTSAARLDDATLTQQADYVSAAQTVIDQMRAEKTAREQRRVS